MRDDERERERVISRQIDIIAAGTCKQNLTCITSRFRSSNMALS